MIEKLAALNEYKEAADLREFKQRFRKKFDARSVQVMEALDPETGIGYGGLEQDRSGDDFVFNLKPEGTGQSLRDTLTAGILSRLVSGKDMETGYIDIEQLPGKENPAWLPNTFSVLCSVEGAFVKVEHIGGCTANALLGRFTPVSAQTEALCRELADIEKQANPHVLFFDIAYMAEGYVDNINRRKSIYDYQLSIGNYDTSAAPLTLNDLYLSLNGEDLILRSKKLNRRMIPRMASAYNHRRSDLPLFRLLSDLQYQGLQADLAFP
ncbi:lantibiotic dehydratase [Mucilaginibacter sp. UC70_90]